MDETKENEKKKIKKRIEIKKSVKEIRIEKMKNIKRNVCIAAVTIGVMNILLLNYLKIIHISHINFETIGTVAITITAIIIGVGIIVMIDCWKD